MKIYLAHTSGYDYSKELYEPIKHTLANEYDIFLPHDEHNQGVNSKDIILNSDIVLAEVSYPSTGQGIELGWADIKGIPIVCFYREDTQPSGALRFVTGRHIIYKTTKDMIDKLRTEIQSLK